MAEARKEAELFGIAMSRADAKKMENINDAITRIKAAIQGAAITLVKQFAPTLEAVGNKLAEWSKSGKLSDWAKQLGQFLIEVIPKGIILSLKAASRLMQAFRGWEMLVTELKIQWLSFMGFVQKGVELFAKATVILLNAANVGGIFDEQIRSLVDFAKEQEQVNKFIQKQKSDTLKEQQKNIEGHEKEQKSIKDLQKEVDSFAKSIRDGSLAAEQEAQAAEKVAAGWKKATVEKQAFVSLGTGAGQIDEAASLRNLARTQGE
jgi:hypothetical protein